MDKANLQAGDGTFAYMRDLTGGTEGLSGSSYVVGELDMSHQDEHGARHGGIERSAIQVRKPTRCDHRETVCAKCAETWMYDWTFYFDRTAGGRRLRDEVGGETALAEMARRRAEWERSASGEGDGLGGAVLADTLGNDA